MAASFAFEGFVLDSSERRLVTGDGTVELNGRYLDALALLVSEQGRLVSKTRFLDEVWRGVPVTDEALTQCIRSLRRALGDDALQPRFIETVPKHGYRFIAAVRVVEVGDTGIAGEPVVTANEAELHKFVITGSAGMLGGALAGVIGGLIYGFAGGSRAGAGAISELLVLLSVTLLVALLGGAGVSFAIASSAFAKSRSWQRLTLLGAAGGLFVGAFGKLLALDAFALLVGRSPSGITGAMEGLLVGAGAGLGAALAMKTGSVRRGTALAALAGALAGIFIALLGGRLMLGSLELVAKTFPSSNLRLDGLAHLFGEERIGIVTRFSSIILEASLFSACLVGMMMLARRRFGLED